MKFKNSPITEAIIDIRVQPAASLNQDSLSKIRTMVAEGYPDQRTMRTFSSVIQVKEGEPSHVSPSDQITGYQLWSADQKQVVQFRFDGMALSRLQPYLGWENIKTEFDSMWSIYQQETNPLNISRTAVRNINTIEIPASTEVDLDEYFTVAPRSPSGLPQQLNNFYYRISIRHDALTQAVVTLALTSGRPGFVSIVLDIDVFSELAFGIDKSSIDSVLMNLRGIKNDVFSNFITQKMKDILNQ